jgi:hypothetical protein
MTCPISLVRLGIGLMILLPAYFCPKALAGSSPRAVMQAAGEQVNLTVTSTCGSASVQVKGRGVLTTPISVTFPRGKTIQLRALDDSLPQCGAVGVASPFRRFVVNQVLRADGKRRVTLTLDQDTAVLLQYGDGAATPVTLSVGSGCHRGAPILVRENTSNGQSGALQTHFDAQFLQGQSLRLEAPPLVAPCDDVATILYFLNWSAAGMAYPQNQTSIDLTLGRFTSAYAHYRTIPPDVSLPTLGINSYQLRRNGEAVDYVPVGENLNDFTFLVSGEPFPPEANVVFFPPVPDVRFPDGQQAEILSRVTPGEIEVRLPAPAVDAPGFGILLVIAPDSRFSNVVPIEIRNE